MDQEQRSEPSPQPDPLPDPAPHDAPESAQPWWSWWHAVELTATFLLFCGVMHFLYAGPRGTPLADIGAPGHDSFYHIKMAVLMPEIGLVDTFPWLRTTVFNEKFVNHHYGFQLLLSPFVHLSHWLTGDYAAGGRWFMTLSFGASMVLFQLLLMVRRIERRWLWLGLCLLLPAQFYSRHLYVRAINPSLICMLALCLCMFTRRYVAAGIVICLSIHIYLGAVTFAPVLVAAVFVAGLAGVVGDRLKQGASLECVRREVLRFDGWQLVRWALAGWLLGLLTHPYGGVEVLRFLKLQVLGSGLTPDIPVGREWKSYSPAWFFANMSGVTLIATGVALCLRMRFGGRLRTDELSLLMINMVFLALVLKARRFIEYWPLFSILSAAYLAGPILGPRPGPARDDGEGRALSRFEGAAVIATCLLAVAACLAGGRSSASYVPDNFAAEWGLWTLLAGLVVLVPIARSWTRSMAHRASTGERVVTVGFVIVSGLAFCAMVAVFIRLLANGTAPEMARFTLGWWPFAALGLAYLVCGVIGVTTAGGECAMRLSARSIRPAITVATAIALTGVVIIPAGALFGGLQRNTRCNYDLPAIREVMQVLESQSADNAVVFTDDWDIFPVYFYFNHHNHYIVGLDPKFSHEKDPVLWERYVRISRGETPATRRVKVWDDGRVATTRVDVKLTDIRDHFHADFVVIDLDHRALANKLDRAPTLARRIFPADAAETEKSPYLLYRILPETDESTSADAGKNMK